MFSAPPPGFTTFTVVRCQYFSCRCRIHDIVEYTIEQDDIAYTSCRCRIHGRPIVEYNLYNKCVHMYVQM